jgi:stringent starvation protein B
MSIPMNPETQGVSTRPYLIRALHDWCSDHGFTPYLAVFVDASVQVPMEYVKNQEIVLNVGHDATSGLKLGNEYVEFKARFGGVPRDIVVPVDHVIAIYARENGQGMAFPVPQAGQKGATSGAASGDTGEQDMEPVRGAPSLVPVSSSSSSEGSDSEPPTPPTVPPAPGRRPALKRVK